MSRSTIAWLVFGLWLIAMALSFASFGAEPTGDGFTRGLNRLTGFVGWQLGALILAVASWIAVQPMAKGSFQRWIGRVPGWWSVALIVGIVGLLVAIPFMDPRPEDGVPNPPVTAPAADAVPVEE